MSILFSMWVTFASAEPVDLPTDEPAVQPSRVEANGKCHISGADIKEKELL